MVGIPGDQRGQRVGAGGGDRAEHRRSQEDEGDAAAGRPALASVQLPKGGGAIRGIGERFTADVSTGTGSMQIPVPIPGGRGGFGPELVLAYDSGAGNGPFGLGWSVQLPAITRKTDNGLPQYRDDEESDVFVLASADDLVPLLQRDGGGEWARITFDRPPHAPEHRIDRYRPRLERCFDRIERWTRVADGDVHWRTVTRDNVTSLFGTSSASRIEDPAPDLGTRRRVFSWLLAATWDDRGNAVIYDYKPEDGRGVDPLRVEEAGRTDVGRSANRYPKRIRYGNRTSLLVQPNLDAAEWLFEVVFDYGEHDQAAPTPGDAGEWLVRNDPFSTYRPGFEVRTYRLCQRILSFHHFPAEPDVGANCLVRSVDFRYRSLTGDDGGDERRGEPVAAFLASVTQRGYRRSGGAGYVSRSIPPVELFYGLPTFHEDVHDLDPDAVAALPAGVTPSGLQWADVDGEGIPGILVSQGGTWLYAPNLGAGRLGRAAPLPWVPSTALAGPPAQLTDLEGDGRLDAVSLDRHAPGFHERTEEGWSEFQSFASFPNIDWDEPNLRFVDLDGDGRADALVTADDRYVWFPSLGERGYGEAREVPVATDEAAGPRLVLGDREQSVYLADMSGDGLSDLVRIRNGEVAYWPNLGHARWGARVTMGSSPRFDRDDLFDQSRIRLFDIDGSGVTDIVYVGPDGIDVYLNQSGNFFAPARRLGRLPEIDDTTSVSTVDLLGGGTACLVWSSGRPGDERRSIRYVDLLGGRKPHLLVASRNNLGAETYITYAPSTAFYLADRAEGSPWATRLAFPVHVVERVEVHDRISRNRFASRYAYHHGYFDPVDREFRGFGMTEQWDAADFAVLGPSDDLATNLDDVHEVPPTRTVTWSHTGAPGTALEDLAKAAAYDDGAPPPPRSSMPAGVRLADGTTVVHAVTGEELREARRALKGSLIRQEVYAADGSDAAARPYTVTERNYAVDLLQPEGSSRHAVCMVHAREMVTSHHERAAVADLRVTHDVVLARDGYGNVLRSVVVAYGRRHELAPPAGGPALPQGVLDAVRPGQRRLWATLTQSTFTNAVDTPAAYRAPLAAESALYELLDFGADGVPASGQRLAFEQIEAKVAVATDGAHDVPPESVDGGPPGTTPRRRLSKLSRRLYRADDLSGPLAIQSVQSMALPHAEYELALTAGLTGAHLPELGDPATVLPEAGYVAGTALEAAGVFASAAPGEWWATSATLGYSPDADHTAAQELAYAREHFFTPARQRDQFGNVATAVHDDYVLLPLDGRDPVGNRVTAGSRSGPDGSVVTPAIDYRVVAPRLVTDANGNANAVAFDALGLVAGIALVGHGPAPEGDDLSPFTPDLDDADLAAFFADPLADPLARLGSATTRYLYDAAAYQRTQDQPDPQPATVCTLTREVHRSDAPTSRVLPSFLYVDGFGREIQRKERAEPGPVADGGPVVTPRWIGSGWTVYDNKGDAVRRFEPFFSATHGFEFDRRVGASAVTFRDPLRRVVANVLADSSWEKTTFGPWHQETWDANDTTLLDPATDADVGGFVAPFVTALRAAPGGWQTWCERRIAGGRGPEEQAAAERAAVHAATSVRSYNDALGRAFAVVDHCRTPRPSGVTEEWHLARVVLDVEDRELAAVDALGRTTIRQRYDLRGSRLRLAAADSGERVTLHDVTGSPVRSWDSRGYLVRTTYDAARRPRESYVTAPGEAERMRERRIYGETVPNGADANLRAQLVHHFDGAGVVTTERYDFKGSATVVTRRFAAAGDAPADWSSIAGRTDADLAAALPANLLAAESFTTRTTFDAMRRPVLIETPDGSRIRPVRNEANLVERLEAEVRGAAAQAFLTAAEYDAKGNRVATELGNGVTRRQLFDPETNRVVRLESTAAGRVLQDRSHVYDAAGNVAAIRDAHQATIFFANAVVEPHAAYEYDSLYRLTRASGREHVGVAGSPAPTWDDAGRSGWPHPEDGQAMRRYDESYTYDAAGNVLQTTHTAANGAWTCKYAYTAPSRIDAAVPSNRVTSTTVGAGAPEAYVYDANGNTTSMPHAALVWDVGDRLVTVDRGGGGRIHYHYDGSGQRIRTVFVRQNGTKASERLYLGGVEVFRKFDGAGITVQLERQTLHVTEETHRLASVETRTVGQDASPTQLARYQLDDHLGSVAVELDDTARVISHEEFYPWGGTSFLAGSSLTQVPKRYRFSGKERDEGTGFTYHGARYYAPWIGRWASCDREVHSDGPNLYVYARDNPVKYVDPDGREARLIVDAATRSVTVQTTVHLYGATGRQVAQLQQVAAAAATQLNNPIVATEAEVDAARQAGGPIPSRGLTATVNGQQWTLRFDIQFQVHDAANPPVRETPGLGNQRATVYDVDAGRLASEGIQTGDNVFTLRPQPRGSSLGGVTTNAQVPGNPSTETNLAGEIYGSLGTQASRDALARRLAHEVGHAVGLDERYSPLQLLGMNYAGFRYDLMAAETTTSANEPRVLDPTHVTDFLEVGEQLSRGGLSQHGPVTWLLSGHLDDTQGGNLQPTGPNYPAAQTAARAAAVTRIQNNTYAWMARQVFPGTAVENFLPHLNTGFINQTTLPANPARRPTRQPARTP